MPADIADAHSSSSTCSPPLPASSSAVFFLFGAFFPLAGLGAGAWRGMGRHQSNRMRGLGGSEDASTARHLALLADGGRLAPATHLAIAPIVLVIARSKVTGRSSRESRDVLQTLQPVGSRIIQGSRYAVADSRRRGRRWAKCLWLGSNVHCCGEARRNGSGCSIREAVQGRPAFLCRWHDGPMKV